MADGGARLPAGWLRRCCSAVAEGPERTWVVRYVVAASGDRLLAPLASALAALESLTLLIPDDARSASTGELLVRAEPVADWRNEADVDRWQAYFGRPDVSAWSWMVIDSGKWGGGFVEAEEWACPNLLAKAEPRLCKRANADRARLERAVAARLGVKPHDSLVVGVDQWGADVRHAGGVTRIAWESVLADAAEAERVIDAWLAMGGA